LRFESLSAKQKPALDESSFQQLLAAAYVVQKHNDSLRADNPQLDTTRVLAEMAEMQSLALAGELDLAASAKLISDRLLKLVAAAGVSISVVSNGYLDCIAESGTPAKVPGSSIASHSLIATERLKAGEIFGSDDAQRDMRLDGALCVRLGIGSLLAAPLFRFGEIAGLVEVRWGWANGFRESDIAVCKLMAGLATEMLEREISAAKELPKETHQPAQAAVPEASSETSPIKSESAPINDEPPAADTNTAVGEKPEAKNIVVAKEPSPPTASTTPQSCRVCGRPLGADEAFCGHCSMPRASAAASNELQSKWASLWFLQRAQDTLQEREATDTSLAVEMPRIVEAGPAAASDPVPDSPGSPPLLDNSHFSYFEPTEAERGAALLEELEDFDYVSPVTRAVRTLRDRLRMKDMLLIVVAATLAFGVFSAWPSSGGQLTWFQSMLVRLGWAQTTAHAPAYLGNPEANVWVDADTALYYCSGSDLYGKTPEGHFASQREAQQQHFKPAAGLACQ
jgi:hypothetical protein